jgi:hypothetical protein
MTADGIVPVTGGSRGIGSTWDAYGGFREISGA